MFFCNVHLVEHSLYVCHYSNKLFSESTSTPVSWLTRSGPVIRFIFIDSPPTSAEHLKTIMNLPGLLGLKPPWWCIISLSQWSRWHRFLSVLFLTCNPQMSYSTESRSHLFWIFFLIDWSSFQPSNCLEVTTLDFSKVVEAGSDHQSVLLPCPSPPWTLHHWRKTLWIRKMMLMVAADLQWSLSHTSFVL